jgi:hypothetical protein
MRVLTSLKEQGRKRVCYGLFALGLLLNGPSNFAGSLDDEIDRDEFLSLLASPLDALLIDVTVNVNNRELGRGRPDQPRLGGFWDIPLGLLPSAREISDWEQDFNRNQLGGVAVIPCQDCTGESLGGDFLKRWLEASDGQRIFISFGMVDAQSAKAIADVARSLGMLVQSLLQPNTSAFAGELFATAGRRLVIDSAEARRLDSEVAEFVYLGERSLRGSDSLFKTDDASRGSALARNEPTVFRKESLGDEFNQSTIQEIIVPGGVALGETARLNFQPSSMEFDGVQLLLTDDIGHSWQLPPQTLAVSRALFDFVERSALIGSDAIVDIDENARVSISSSLRNTDAGYEIMHADTQPFEYISNLPVTKSVVIDTLVKWERDSSGEFAFNTEFEVRFLSADNMRIAQTRAALVYEYEWPSRQVNYHKAWGREARRLNQKVDYAGLGYSMEKVAHYAGWIALFRKFKQDKVPFLRGRYQFMTLSNKGRTTPIRY